MKQSEETKTRNRYKILLATLALAIAILLFLMATVWQEGDPDPKEFIGEPTVQELLQQ